MPKAMTDTLGRGYTTMTVGELIKVLSDFDPETLLYMASDNEMNAIQSFSGEMAAGAFNKDGAYEDAKQGAVVADIQAVILVPDHDTIEILAELTDEQLLALFPPKSYEEAEKEAQDGPASL